MQKQFAKGNDISERNENVDGESFWEGIGIFGEFSLFSSRYR